jgi:hypothetical protein
MKYILVFQLFLSGLFAHGEVEGHIHFFSTLHVESFVLFLVVLVVGFSIFKYASKERN